MDSSHSNTGLPTCQPACCFPLSKRKLTPRPPPSTAGLPKFPVLVCESEPASKVDFNRHVSLLDLSSSPSCCYYITRPFSLSLSLPLSRYSCISSIFRKEAVALFLIRANRAPLEKQSLAPGRPPVFSNFSIQTLPALFFPPLLKKTASRSLLFEVRATLLVFTPSYRFLIHHLFDIKPCVNRRGEHWQRQDKKTTVKGRYRNSKSNSTETQNTPDNKPSVNTYTNPRLLR